MRKKIKKGSICLLCLMLLIIWMGNIICINKKYPEAILDRHLLGETFEWNGFEICATDIQFLDENYVNTIFKDEIENFGGCKCVLVFLTITNNSTEMKEIQLYPLILQSGAWKNSILMMTFGDISQMYYPELPVTLHPKLEAGESIQCVLPYTMVKTIFTDKQWEKCENAEYELVFSLYPVKTFIKLQ